MKFEVRRVKLGKLVVQANAGWPSFFKFHPLLFKLLSTLPTVLSRQEVDELLRCTANLKQRTFLTTLYATGMRISEAANLQLDCIDSQRMQIHVRHGKGAKDRQVPLSPRLLNELRAHDTEFAPVGTSIPHIRGELQVAADLPSSLGFVCIR